MPRPPSKYRHEFLRLVHELRVSDLFMLIPLLSVKADGVPTFGRKGIERASEALFEQGYLHRLWMHRDPKFRFDRGSRRKVLRLSRKGAEKLGLQAQAVRNSETRYKALADPRTEHRLEHELMIARIHASLLLAQREHPDVLAIREWLQGDECEISCENFKIRPDALIHVRQEAIRREWFFALEADTGNERQESREPTRPTIAKKVSRYGIADARDAVRRSHIGHRKWCVLFVVPRRSDSERLSGRETNMLDLIARKGHISNHEPKFYRVMSETDVESALAEPTHYFRELVVRHITAEGKIAAEPLIPPPPLHGGEASSYAASAESVV